MYKRVIIITNKNIRITITITIIVNNNNNTTHLYGAIYLVILFRGALWNKNTTQLGISTTYSRSIVTNTIF